MALRVNSQDALDWLGIEGFRPSGRLARPERSGPVEEGALAEESSTDSEAVPIPAETPRSEAESVPRGGADEALPPEPTSAAAAAPESAGSAGPPRSAGPSKEDAVVLAADSAQRGLGEAIAGMSGLPCREAADPADEGVCLDGHLWSMADLAGNAAAKRRLWQALVRRKRGRS